MKKLLVWSLILASAFSCEDDQSEDLSGRYNFIEPPHPIVRMNRLDFSQVAFDVIFTINGNELTEIDLVLDGYFIDGEIGSISPSIGNQILFEGGGARIELHGVRKLGHALYANEAIFELNGQSTSYGAVQIDRYRPSLNGGGDAECLPENRVGAVCNDGTYSTATGSGACSNHNGVRSWLCK